MYAIVMDIISAIKNEIQNSGRSHYRICEDLKLSQAQLCRLMQGKQGLSVDTAGRLLAYFGYTLKKGRVKQ